MKKIFSNVQTLKSGEDCKKFSKSVSYETLVGGTATTGRGIKQTQKMFLGNADKPLTAVGTLTSLLCNSSKVVEKLLRHVITRRTSARRGYLPEQWTHVNEESLFASVTCFMRLPRRIQRMLLVMTIPALALLFTLITTSESQAGIIARGDDCAYNDGVSECHWEIDSNGKLSITGSGSMIAYDAEFFNSRPWQDHISDVTSINISGVSQVGNNLFRNMSAVENVVLSDSVKIIGPGAFKGATSLTSIDMPNVVKLGDNVFNGAISLTSVDMPKIKTIGYSAFQYAESLTFAGGIPELRDDGYYYKDDVKISDSDGYLVDDNGNHLDKHLRIVTDPSNYVKVVGNNIFSNTDIPNCGQGGSCGHCDYYVMHGLGCVPDCGAGYLGKEGRCIDASLGCGAGYRQFENFCNRIQYTPAEAAQVLRDDNNNSVTITFRK